MQVLINNVLVLEKIRATLGAALAGRSNAKEILDGLNSVESFRKMVEYVEQGDFVHALSHANAAFNHLDGLRNRFYDGKEHAEQQYNHSLSEHRAKRSRLVAGIEQNAERNINSGGLERKLARVNELKIVADNEYNAYLREKDISSVGTLVLGNEKTGIRALLLDCVDHAECDDALHRKASSQYFVGTEPTFLQKVKGVFLKGKESVAEKLDVFADVSPRARSTFRRTFGANIDAVTPAWPQWEQAPANLGPAPSGIGPVPKNRNLVPTDVYAQQPQFAPPQWPNQPQFQNPATQPQLTSSPPQPMGFPQVMMPDQVNQYASEGQYASQDQELGSQAAYQPPEIVMHIRNNFIIMPDKSLGHMVRLKDGRTAHIARSPTDLLYHFFAPDFPLLHGQIANYSEDIPAGRSLATLEGVYQVPQNVQSLVPTQQQMAVPGSDVSGPYAQNIFEVKDAEFKVWLDSITGKGTRQDYETLPGASMQVKESLAVIDKGSKPVIDYAEAVSIPQPGKKSLFSSWEGRRPPRDYYSEVRAGYAQAQVPTAIQPEGKLTDPVEYISDRYSQLKFWLGSPQAYIKRHHDETLDSVLLAIDRNPKASAKIPTQKLKDASLLLDDIIAGLAKPKGPKGSKHVSKLKFYNKLSTVKRHLKRIKRKNAKNKYITLSKKWEGQTAKGLKGDIEECISAVSSLEKMILDEKTKPNPLGYTRGITPDTMWAVYDVTKHIDFLYKHLNEFDWDKKRNKVITVAEVVLILAEAVAAVYLAKETWGGHGNVPHPVIINPETPHINGTAIQEVGLTQGLDGVVANIHGIFDHMSGVEYAHINGAYNNSAKIDKAGNIVITDWNAFSEGPHSLELVYKDQNTTVPLTHTINVDVTNRHAVVSGVDTDVSVEAPYKVLKVKGFSNDPDGNKQIVVTAGGQVVTIDGNDNTNTSLDGIVLNLPLNTTPGSLPVHINVTDQYDNLVKFETVAEVPNIDPDFSGSSYYIGTNLSVSSTKVPWAVTNITDVDGFTKGSLDVIIEKYNGSTPKEIMRDNVSLSEIHPGEKGNVSGQFVLEDHIGKNLDKGYYRVRFEKNNTTLSQEDFHVGGRAPTLSSFDKTEYTPEGGEWDFVNQDGSIKPYNHTFTLDLSNDLGDLSTVTVKLDGNLTENGSFTTAKNKITFDVNVDLPGRHLLEVLVEDEDGVGKPVQTYVNVPWMNHAPYTDTPLVELLPAHNLTVGSVLRIYLPEPKDVDAAHGQEEAPVYKSVKFDNKACTILSDEIGKYVEIVPTRAGSLGLESVIEDSYKAPYVDSAWVPVSAAPTVVLHEAYNVENEKLHYTFVAKGGAGWDKGGVKIWLEDLAGNKIAGTDTFVPKANVAINGDVINATGDWNLPSGLVAGKYKLGCNLDEINNVDASGLDEIIKMDMRPIIETHFEYISNEVKDALHSTYYNTIVANQNDWQEVVRIATEAAGRSPNEPISGQCSRDYCKEVIETVKYLYSAEADIISEGHRHDLDNKQLIPVQLYLKTDGWACDGVLIKEDTNSDGTFDNQYIASGDFYPLDTWTQYYYLSTDENNPYSQSDDVKFIAENIHSIDKDNQLSGAYDYNPGYLSMLRTLVSSNQAADIAKVGNVVGGIKRAIDSGVNDLDVDYVGNTLRFD